MGKQYTFDIDKACKHLRANSQPKSISRCATYVKNAMKAGGLPYITGDGKDLGRICNSLGFRQISLQVNNSTRSVTGMQKGDIASMTHGKYGHTCMYDGTQWISDFRQNFCIPYSRGGWGNLTFWRWTDNPIYSGDDGGPIQPIAADTGFAGGSPPPDYTTFSGSRGDIFQGPESNAFTIASIARNIDSSNAKTNHTRIYSTNDATIILDELSMPLTDTSTNTTTNTSTNT